MQIFTGKNKTYSAIAFSTYHLFSNAILVSAQKPTIVTIDITHFSNIVPKNWKIIPIKDSGNVTIKKTEITIPQNLLNLIGMIWLAITVIRLLIIVIRIDDNDVDWAAENDSERPPLTHKYGIIPVMTRICTRIFMIPIRTETYPAFFKSNLLIQANIYPPTPTEFVLI